MFKFCLRLLMSILCFYMMLLWVIGLFMTYWTELEVEWLEVELLSDLRGLMGRFCRVVIWSVWMCYVWTFFPRYATWCYVINSWNLDVFKTKCCLENLFYMLKALLNFPVVYSLVRTSKVQKGHKSSNYSVSDSTK